MSKEIAPIFLTPQQRHTIEAEGSAAYPNECCGIIFGKDLPGRGRVVERLENVPNDFDSGEQYHRFLISTQTLMAAEKKCRDGLMVLGFYHSHPDHPARPSEYDRQHAWPFYSYIIVAIERKKPGAMTSWVLDELTEQFVEQLVEQGIE